MARLIGKAIPSLSLVSYAVDQFSALAEKSQYLKRWPRHREHLRQREPNQLTREKPQPQRLHHPLRKHSTPQCAHHDLQVPGRR